MATACLVIIGAGVLLWNRLASPTRIAFVNYQAIELGRISKANDNSFIKISELPVDRLDRASDYDMVFLFAMGLRITDEQRQALVKAAENGTPVYTQSATNPQNMIVSVDSIDNEFLRQYNVGGRANYRNMLRYVRKFIDGKKFFADEPGDPAASASSLIYYPSESDNLNFGSVADYEKWLRENGKWNDDAPKIILTGQMGVADSLVAQLERTGNTVYPVNVIQTFITRGHADSIGASALINMAHG
ncbi:MAG: cobaltochelatase subunit CobN, partial [Candidatus Amulumruptor sp.]|nr:cobaltochelatase subunit CobN [Candidatus Amulumruptor sp.]